MNAADLTPAQRALLDSASVRLYRARECERIGPEHDCFVGLAAADLRKAGAPDLAARLFWADDEQTGEILHEADPESVALEIDRLLGR